MWRIVEFSRVAGIQVNTKSEFVCVEKLVSITHRHRCLWVGAGTQ